MAKRLYISLLFLIVLAGPAAAQTTATTSGTAGITLANLYGAVALPGTTATSSTAAAAPSTAVASPSSANGSSAGSGAGPSTAPAASSATPGSSGSSKAGTAANSNNVPAWLLCPPSGATGMAPFVTGTNLSCAP